MKIKLNTNQRGFTIIEVVLVLAIAGLIFLMVFIALPALQAGQRDTSRKNDLSIIAATVTSLKSANKGQNPTQSMLRSSLAGGLSDNTDPSQIIVWAAPANTTTASINEANGKLGQVGVVFGYKCVSSSTNGVSTITPGSKAQFIVFGRLEGGNASGYCIDG